MPKSTKHKKAIKKEKTKIKLKLGRGKNLPKGVNVTNTSFQTRKIVLPEQKGSENNKLVNPNNLSIKKSLKSLDYNSVYVRQDGLNDLKKLADYNIDLFSPCLEDVFSCLSKLFVDADNGLRRDAIRLVQKILSMKSTNEIAPFFGFLAAMLSCSMNNINQGVKQDSIRILDAFVETVPSLMKPYAKRILLDFVDQISRKSEQGSRGRVLIVNPVSKLTTLKWRTVILKRIESLIVLSNKALSVVQPSLEYTCPTIVFPSVLESELYHPAFLNCDTSLDLSLKSYDVFEASREKTNESIANSLLPILIETWVEAAPEQNGLDEIEGKQITSDMIEVLRSIIAVLKALESCNQLGTGQVNNDDYRKLLSKLMESFPYSMRGISKRGNAVADSCLQDNLDLLYLCVKAEKHLESSFLSFLRYIEEIFQNQDISISDSGKVIGIVKELLTDGSCSQFLLEKFLPNLLSFSERKKNNDPILSQTLEAVVDIAIVNHHRLLSLKQYRDWLKKGVTQLPLNSSASLKALDILTRNAFVDLSALKEIALKLSDTLCSVSTEGATESQSLRHGVQLIGNAAIQFARSGDVTTAQELCNALGNLHVHKTFSLGLKTIATCVSLDKIGK
ncbi:testis-expressed protein 10 homolog isoform X2 [Artemia franciscana]|uniref:testis-expressed protein 10 homolog isoform X2 n=1 Tax=Artemia franciscana TaxID=6661 RepID=UPI0032D9B1E3